MDPTNRSWNCHWLTKRVIRHTKAVSLLSLWGQFGFLEICTLAYVPYKSKELIKQEETRVFTTLVYISASADCNICHCYSLHSSVFVVSPQEIKSI